MPFINLGKNSPKKDNSVAPAPTDPVVPAPVAPAPVPPTPAPRDISVVVQPSTLPTEIAFQSSDTDSLVANGNVPIDLGSNAQVTQDKKVTEITSPTPVAPAPVPTPADVAANLDQKLEAMSEPTPVKPAEIAPAPLPPIQEGLQNKSYSLIDFMQEAVKLNASDLHISAGYRAMARVNGILAGINSPILTPEQTKEFAHELVRNRKDVDFENLNEFDLTYNLNGRRFRVNIFKQMGTFAIAARVISEKIPTPEDLDLPPIARDFSKYPNGLVLVTGPTGSGKSTTIASILNLVNLTETKHIITLEDPVEYVFPKGLSMVDQREFGNDFLQWPNALRAILRQDPNIVLVGEMRDLDTVESALRIAETGHLVLATLHTNSAAQTVDRIIDMFPGEKQEQIKVQLSSVLQAIVSQRLVRTIQGGRVAAQEILIANPAVRNTIRESKGIQLDNIIQTSADLGMMSLEKSLAELVKAGKITSETGKATANRPNDFDILLNKS